MINTSLRSYLICAGMLVTGALLATAYIHRLSPQTQDAATQPSAPGSASAASALADSRIAALESKLANLQAKRSQRADLEPERVQNSQRYSPEAFAERKRANEERWKEQLEIHAREPLDPAWARKAAASLSSDITKLSQELGFRFVHTDCRTTECAANLEFPDYRSAQSTFQTLLQANYEMNCGTEIVLPEPADAQKPYRATILYHCENS